MLRPCQDLAQPFAAFLDLDRRLVPDIFDIALKKVGDLFHRRAKRETVPEFGEINRGPWPFMLRAHGSLHQRNDHCFNRHRSTGFRDTFAAAANCASGGYGQCVRELPRLLACEARLTVRGHRAMFCDALI
jgi:hypothetical protein